MRKYLFLFALMFSLSLSAVDYGFSVGIRGGGTTYMPGGKIGVNTGLDMNFSYLWPVGNDVCLGIRTGVSGFYTTSALKTTIHDEFVNHDCYGLELDYTVTGNLSQHHQQFLFGVPVMFAGEARGFVFAVGVRPMLPLYSNCTQDVSNLHIAAYYPEFDVTIADEPVLGVASPYQLHQSREDVLPVFNLLCGLELGYEWELNGRLWYRSKISHRLGVAAYFDIAAYSSPFRSAKSSKPFVSVSEIPNEQEDAVVTIPIYAPKSFRYMDFGIKLYYAFQTRNRYFYGRRR